MDIGTPDAMGGNCTLDDSMVFLENEEQDNREEIQHALVGKIITDRLLNKGAVKNMLLKAWGNPDSVQVVDVGQNLFLFTFNTKGESVDILSKSPWFVMNKLINLQEWNPHVAMSEIDFSKVPFSIQIQGLPLEFLSVKYVEKIFQQLGVVMEIEDPLFNGKLVRSFIRARVEIDTKCPLSTGCWVPRRNLPKVWVSIKYERLQDLCFKCGIIGHEQKICQKEKVMSALGSNIQRYSHRVGVYPAKPLKRIIEEQERRRNYTHGESSQGSASTSKEESRGEESKDEVGSKELLLDNDRLEYEQMLEAHEGNGEMPTGWHEVHSEAARLPMVPEALHRGRLPVSGYTPFSNLRLKILPGFRGVFREDDVASFSLPDNGVLSGSEFLGNLDLGQQSQVGSPNNDGQSSRDKGVAAMDTHQQSQQNIVHETITGQSYEQNDAGNSAGAETDCSNQNQRAEGGKEWSGRQSDWWAKEKIDNAVAYEKLQTELQALREEIRTHLHGKVKEASAQNEAVKDAGGQTQRTEMGLDRRDVLA